MNNELKVVLKAMSDSEIADYVLLLACEKITKTNETDVIEVIKHCFSFLDYLRHEADCSSTKIFNVFEIIIAKLKTVSGDGGIVTVERQQEPCKCCENHE